MLLLRLFLCAAAVSALFAAEPYAAADAHKFLNTYCRACHQGKNAVGGFDVDALKSIGTAARKWTSAAMRVHNSEMPPKNAPAPALEDRERFTAYIDGAVRAAVCSAGPVPGPAPIRRLNRDEYAATIRDLLDLHMDLGRALPADGAGGEGFDNAAETLFLSPLHSEKYLDVAKFAMDFAAKEFKSREKIFIAMPGRGVTPGAAARKILANFLPRAFRRPVDAADIAPYHALYLAARAQGLPFEDAVLFALRSALVSPRFLFRSEPPNLTAEARRVDSYALASRSVQDSTGSCGRTSTTIRAY